MRCLPAVVAACLILITGSDVWAVPTPGGKATGLSDKDLKKIIEEYRKTQELEAKIQKRPRMDKDELYQMAYDRYLQTTKELEKFDGQDTSEMSLEEWNLRNTLEVVDTAIDDAIRDMTKVRKAFQSSVLEKKLGEWNSAKGEFANEAEFREAIRKLNPRLAVKVEAELKEAKKDMRTLDKLEEYRKHIDVLKEERSRRPVKIPREPKSDMQRVENEEEYQREMDALNEELLRRPVRIPRNAKSDMQRLDNEEEYQREMDAFNEELLRQPMIITKRKREQKERLRDKEKMDEKKKNFEIQWTSGPEAGNGDDSPHRPARAMDRTDKVPLRNLINEDQHHALNGVYESKQLIFLSYKKPDEKKFEMNIDQYHPPSAEVDQAIGLGRDGNLREMPRKWYEGIFCGIFPNARWCENEEDTEKLLQRRRTARFGSSEDHPDDFDGFLEKIKD